MSTNIHGIMIRVYISSHPLWRRVCQVLIENRRRNEFSQSLGKYKPLPSGPHGFAILCKNALTHEGKKEYRKWTHNLLPENTPRDKQAIFSMRKKKKIASTQKDVEVATYRVAYANVGAKQACSTKEFFFFPFKWFPLGVFVLFPFFFCFCLILALCRPNSARNSEYELREIKDLGICVPPLCSWMQLTKGTKKSWKKDGVMKWWICAEYEKNPPLQTRYRDGVSLFTYNFLVGR